MIFLYTATVYVLLFTRLAYRNCLRASFYAQFFLHWHCMHWPLHSLERTWASQLRQSMLTWTSTAHRDPSLAAPMLTTRFSYTREYGGVCTYSTVYSTCYAGALRSLPLSHNAEHSSSSKGYLFGAKNDNCHHLWALHRSI